MDGSFIAAEESFDVRVAPAAQAAPPRKRKIQAKPVQVTPVQVTPVPAAPVRAKKARPLSPICPYTSEAQIPRRLKLLKNSLPWGISISLHAIAVLMGIATVKEVMREVRVEHAIEGALSESPSAIVMPAVAVVEQTSNPMEQMVKAMPADLDAPPPREPAIAAESQLATEAAAHAQPAAPTDQPIVLGAAVNQVAAATPKHRANRRQFAFAAKEKPAPQPSTANFFGITGNARRIVYLCDASGSMMGTDEAIATQLQRAVLALSPTQEFNLVFFSGGSVPVAFNPSRLLTADPNNKISACNFAKQFTCRGKTNALPALQTALNFKPDIVYLVTDGALDTVEETEVLAAVRNANQGGTTQVNVILISGASQVDPNDLRFLTSVAQETGGTCRVVNPNSL